MIALVLAAVVLGALWRRWFGGWLPNDWPRWMRLAPAFGIGCLAAAYAPMWWQFGLALAFTLYWVPGHKLQEWAWWQWLLRYGPPGVVYIVVQKWRWPGWSGTILDGPFAIAELGIGAAVYGLLALACCLLF